MIAVFDTEKPDARETVAAFRKAGVRTVLLSGDHEAAACAVGKNLGVDETVAGVLPEEKAEVVRRMKKEGKVIMVGDGINDAPALTEADVGIAVGAGADVAVDSAEIVLRGGEIREAYAAYRLGRKTLAVIRENLFWALFYNLLGIPLAAGLFGWVIPPYFGAAAMSLSSLCVVLNALRINLFRLKDRKKEKKTMQITLKIEGMMCPHCEARVKTALLAQSGVTAAEVSFKEGTAVVTGENLMKETLSMAVKAEGYEVIG